MEFRISDFGFWIGARPRKPGRARPCASTLNPKSKITNPKSPRSLRSYTLIELLIVIGILGISGALLVPQMVGRDVMACQAAVRLIIGDLSFAQSDALAHQEIRRVHFYDDGSGYCIVRVSQSQLSQPFDDATADYILDPLAHGDDLGRYIVNFMTDDRFNGVSITTIEIDGTGSDLHYDALGGTVTGTNTPGIGGRIIVTSPNDSYEITIAPFTGKLTVQRL